MSNQDNKCKQCEESKIEVSYEPEVNVDPSKECDPSNPDYPWVSCGLDKKDKKNEEDK